MLLLALVTQPFGKLSAHKLIALVTDISRFLVTYSWTKLTSPALSCMTPCDACRRCGCLRCNATTQNDIFDISFGVCCTCKR